MAFDAFHYFTSQDESLYDAAQNIEYLDMVWQESLRMYAPVGWYVSIHVTAFIFVAHLLTYSLQLHLCMYKLLY